MSFDDESTARMLENMATKIANRDRTIAEYQHALEVSAEEIKRLQAGHPHSVYCPMCGEVGVIVWGPVDKDA